LTISDEYIRTHQRPTLRLLALVARVFRVTVRLTPAERLQPQSQQNKPSPSNHGRAFLLVNPVC
jgi:hypothetical protein